MLNQTKKIFKEQYKEDGKSFYFSPGRVNLIGEYTDIAGGHVFPAALELGVWAVVSPRKDKKVSFFSGNMLEAGKMEMDIDTISYCKSHGWCNYLKGMFTELAKEGFTYPHGLNIAIMGNLPNGAGLSSSACIEVLMGKIILEEYGYSLDNKKLVRHAVACENDFVGVNCGVMDQFAVCFGKKDKAIILDTKTLEYEYGDFPLDKIDLVIMNTNKRRGLQDSKYNERRAEVDSAIADLKTVLEFESLCDLSSDIFEKNVDVIKNELAVKRARHLINENERVMKALNILNVEHDIKAFGQLLNASHSSLKEDFDVTGIELDTIVRIAQENGAIGARMTGAGFGGCGVMICEKNKTSKLMEVIEAEYKEIIGYAPQFYNVTLGDGTRRL